MIREEAIRWLNFKSGDIYDHVFYGDEAPEWEDYEYEALSMAIEALKQTAWIPCSERLPEDGRAVLIYAWSVHYVIARYGSFRTENGYKNTWVTADAWNGNTEIRHEVIAWMPLPEPWKGDSNELHK